MRAETEQDIYAAALRGQEYDEACKRVLNNKEIIAPILQMLVPEYRDCTVEEVIRYIDADSISGDEPVDDIPPEIEQMQTEFSSVSEKLVRFDSLFRAVNPKLSDRDLVVKLHIDIGVQNDYRPGDPAYPLIKRGIYYGAREISRQLGTITGTTDYGRLEKVYSIWICNENIPPHLRGTITRYDMQRTDVIGTTDEPEADFDLMSIVIVRRGIDATEDGIFDFLDGVFKSDLKTISKYVDARRSEKLVKEVEDMSGLGASLIEKNLEKGRAEGRTEGVNSAIERLAEHYMKENPELTKEKALEMASKILR